MSLDSSLKIKGALRRHRNDLSRAERIERLKEEDCWTEGDAVIGLPKVAHRKSHSGKKSSAKVAKVEVEQTEDSTKEPKTES